MTFEKIQKYNRRLMEGLSLYMNLTPRYINSQMVAALSSECDLTDTEGVSLLLAAAIGLDIDGSEEDRELFFEYFPLMLTKLDTKSYTCDPYYMNVSPDSEKFGKWELRSMEYAPYELFVWGDLHRHPDGKLVPRIGFFEEGFSFPAVLEGGREWMTVTPNEIETMAEPISLCHGRVLTYGLGLGYFTYMAARKEEVESVTVVERDPNVIKLFKECILPFFDHPEKIKLIEADAFEFASEVTDGEYQVIFTDIWHDPSDGLSLYNKMKGYEQLTPSSRHLYWIEKTLRCYK